MEDFCRRVQSVLFLFFICTAALFSRSYSETYANFFSKLGYAVSSQLLENSQSEDFPHNVIISFGTKGRHRLTFAVPQQGAQPLLPFLSELCAYLEKNPPNYQVDLVLTANDFSLLPPELTNPQPAGTLSAIENLKTFIDYSDSITATEPAADGKPTNAYQAEKKQRTAAVVILVPAAENQPRVKITAGALGTISPSWLLQKLCAALEQASVPYDVAEQLPFLYHLGFQETQPVLGAYLENGIPAVYCSLVPELDARLFASFIESYSDGFPQEWDSHYFFFRIKDKPVVFPERLIVTVLVILVFIFLFFLFEFSFLSQQRRNNFISILKKNWFVILFLVFFTAVSLLAAQLITKSTVIYWQTYTIQAFAIKMLFFFVFVSLLAMVQQSFLPVDSVFIYDYLLRGAGLLNMLIFSAIDVSLFVFFAAEYLFILLLTLTRTRKSVIAVMIFMGLPFLPFFSIIRSIQHSSIAYALVSSSVKSTAFLSLVLIPFELGVMRYLTLRRYYIKKPKKSISLLFSGLIVISFLCISFLLVGIGFAGKPQQKEGLNITPASGALTVTASQSTVYDLTDTRLTMSVQGTAVRFDIAVSSPSGIPVMEASVPHTEISGATVRGETADGENTHGMVIVFTPDEYPPNPFTFYFSSWNTDRITVTVRSHFISRENASLISSEGLPGENGVPIQSEEKTFILEKKGKK